MIGTKNEPFGWGFEAGFLRSPVNPRMLLLNRTPEIDCSGDGIESSSTRAWGLVSIANDLLRVDLSSLFKKSGAAFISKQNSPFISIYREPFTNSPPLLATRQTIRRTRQPNRIMTID